MAPFVLPERTTSAVEHAWTGLGAPGTWWTGSERLAIVEAIRAAEPLPIGTPVPDLRSLPAKPDPVLSPVVTEVARRVAVDAGRIDAAWAAVAIEALGPGRYTELVALAVTTVPIDLLCRLLGADPPPLPAAEGGEPSRIVPPGVADGEAFVPWVVEGWMGPNVARALSYVPADNVVRMRLVQAMYADEAQFARLVWEERALCRPQVELLAARTSAINECFY